MPRSGLETQTQWGDRARLLFTTHPASPVRDPMGTPKIHLKYMCEPLARDPPRGGVRPSPMARGVFRVKQEEGWVGLSLFTAGGGGSIGGVKPNTPAGL